jgi:hypothetical protein
MQERGELLAEEALIVRHSGEIPEIAFHGSLHYLSQDPQGPQIVLQEEEIALLRQEALARFREIILRDLDPENRGKPIYRGLQRCICNWQRLGNFCRRQAIPVSDHLRREVAQALRAFLAREDAEARAGLQAPARNCGPEALEEFVRLLNGDLHP